MSTILEALKKSEQERKLNNLPTLSDMPPPQEPSRLPIILLLVICVLLAALLGFLVLQWWAGQASVPSKTAVIENDVSTPKGNEGSEEELDISSADDIVLNVVSYAPDPAQRFAMLNGKMVREGEFVQPGLKLEQINTDSVVVVFRGEELRVEP